MIPLKKIFPVIVVLITLSLLGIIYIQVSWIRSTAILRKEQMDQHITEATDLVREAMVNRQGTALRLKMDRVEHTEKGLTFDRYEFKPAYIPPVSSRWEISEVRRLIADKLRERKLDTTFGFAVFGKIAFGSEIRMQSANFANIVEQARYDSAGYVAQYIPLISSYESLNEQSETLVIVLSNSNRNLLASLSWMIIGGILFTVIIITAFALTIRTMLNQKKLSEIKSDFINNMTHELKTPLATISLAIDAIGNEKVMDNRDKIRYFSGIIKEENKRMNKQVESILQSALLEKMRSPSTSRSSTLTR
ncbi:histidine kinase dimerization/phospho-acceptor domain-containing protein [Chitinophaga sp. MD30]|uniref:histidine kinase dimerization/phospho-acceptor domain-containing protein n=1 Tax=Chitinophaga sp. MD30 TaxID=2033437 RepID=UPI001E28B177|nr:histidine kinase dimerization/phospho-acceptor domain-containing protein [Chitinophaga sp. MD30]